MPDPVEQDLPEDMLYDDIIHQDEADSSGSLPAVKMSLNAKLSNNKRQFKKPDEAVVPTDETELDITALPHKDIYAMPMQDKFPHGPRTFEDPVVAAPRSLNLDLNPETTTAKKPSEIVNKIENTSSPRPETKPVMRRRRRNIVVSDRKARSANVGVSSLYEVISEADLAFSPDSRAEAVTVFQGRIREEVVYGICMPVPGFSLLFVIVAVSAVVSALVAGSLLYRYQLQKEHLVERSQHQNGAVAMSVFSGWMGLRLLKMRGGATSRPTEQNGKAGDNSLVLNGKVTETRLQE